MSLIHEHCLSCISTCCVAIPGGDCEVAECANKCGLLFHKCKQNDHDNSCMKMVVPCLNRQFGCPREFPRCHLSEHLHDCPASTVHMNNILSADMGIGSLEFKNRIIRRSEFYSQSRLRTIISDNMARQPCPMASEGCTFTFINIQPLDPLGRLVQSDLAPTYSLQPLTNPPSEENKSDPMGISIKDFPLEILDKVLSFLDSFSLFNLSLTCKSLRDACRSQLTKNGMVRLEWKIKDKDLLKWTSQKKWSFSIGTTPVHKWQYNGAHPLMHHLATCQFYQRSRNKHEEPKVLIHDHCQNCVSASCVVNPEGSCKVSECSNKCGLFFHPCKQTDHNNSCMKMLVPCLNSQYGCPLQIFRFKLGEHLQNCPASTVYVDDVLANAMNLPHEHRFLRRSEYESQLTLRLAISENVVEQPCPMASEGCTFTFTSAQPLEPRGRLVKSDMVSTYIMQPLIESSDSTSKVSSNSDLLTEKNNTDFKGLCITEFPAEILGKMLSLLDSFSLYSLSLTCKSLREACRCHLTRKGLVCIQRKLVDQSEGLQWKTEKKWSFSIGTTPVHEWQYNGAHPLMHHLGTCQFYQRSRNKHEEPKVLIHDHCQNCVSASCVVNPEGSCKVFECSNKCGLFFHPCKQTDHNNSCMKMLVPCLNSQYGCPLQIFRFKLGEHLQNCPASTVYVDDVLANAMNLPHEHRFLRRSEYESQLTLRLAISENVVEQPCPMASEGCTFTFTSAQPLEPRGRLVKSDMVPTYIMQPLIESSDSTSKVSSNSDLLTEKNNTDFKGLCITELPAEILGKMLSLLDSFSLYSLSLTCKSLREACRCHLTRKGLVCIQRKLVDQSEGLQWKTEKKWSFSIGTTPVHEWQYNGALPLMHHLAVCPYYQGSRNKHEGPHANIIEELVLQRAVSNNANNS